MRHDVQGACQRLDASGHAIIQSFEPGEYWRWCYADEREV